MPLATASVHPYRTKKGTRYCVRFREGGRQKHETVPGYGRQAKEIARERASEIEMGRHYVAPPQTLGAFLAEWLEREFNNVKPSTLKRKREALRALGVLSERDRKEGNRGTPSAAPSRMTGGTGGLPARRVGAQIPGEVHPSRSLSESPLDRLQVADVEDALAALARRAPRQAQMARAALLMALKDAERRGQRIDKGLLEIKANRYRGRVGKFLDWPQVTELASWMLEEIGRIVLVAALTGMRQGELFDLREWDLELDQSFLRVEHESAPDRSLKTESSERIVRLPAEAVKQLREQLVARRHTQGGYVFPAPLGGRWSKDNFMARAFRPACKRAGLEGVRFHDLRHTYVSLSARAGMRQEVIEKNAGWSPGAAREMYDRYRHVYPEEQDIGIAKLDALVRGKETAKVEEAEGS